METEPNFACWTSTPAGVLYLLKNFIRLHLFLTVLRKSACRDVVDIFQSIQMLSEIFFDAPHGLFDWFCGELLVISIKYNFSILFTVANYVMYISGIFHCEGQAWSRLWTGSGGHHRLSTVGLPGQSWWSLYQWCQQWSHDRLSCTMLDETWWKSRRGQLIHQDRWQISLALQEAHHSDRLGAHFSLLPMHGNAAGHSF